MTDEGNAARGILNGLTLSLASLALLLSVLL